MKADNELAVNLPVLFKSVKKWKYVKKQYKKLRKQKQNDHKKSKKKNVWWGSKPHTINM